MTTLAESVQPSKRGEASQRGSGGAFQRQSARAQRVFDWRNAGWTHPQIQAKLGISHQTLWKIIKSPEYAALVEDLEARAMEIHSGRELFRSMMRELKDS